MKKSYAELEKENRELKMEIEKMRIWKIRQFENGNFRIRFSKSKKPAAKVFKEKSN